MSIKTAIYESSRAAGSYELSSSAGEADETTTEFLFLTDNEPDITAHTLWRLGVLHIYRPGDWPNILVSVDPHGERDDWAFQHREPSTLPSLLPPHPWISYDEVTYGLADAEIVPFDIWRRSDRRGQPHPQHWDEFDRPMLVRLPAAPLAPTPRRQQSHRVDERAPSHSLPAPSAPPAQPTRNVSLSAAGAAVTPSGRLPLPPHIQRLVIDAAIAAAATCPVTMEPITAETAVITPCGHVFGTELTSRVSLCPVCRSSL